MKKKKCVAMLLAGGQGTRLLALTAKVAKPAVSFGAKYRIIDFTLSNCANSGIETVGVLTQYEPLLLNEYIGNGRSWDLDRAYGGVHVLSPYQAKSGAEWYKGTANAIYQNTHFLEKYDSEHVLILSGDHIYQMDYSLMLAEHIANNADCTIAVIDVPLEEASRFGIMDYNDQMQITDFDEKPPVPKSNHASMGVYIFKKDELIAELIADENDKKSSKDFGKNIIPKMLREGKRMFAYHFEGYWKDVGTITSLWEANMDLLKDEPSIDFDDSTKHVYANNEALPPCYIGETGTVKNCFFTAGSEIMGEIDNSIIFENVVIGKGSVVKNSIIMRGVKIGENVNINYGIIDEDTVIMDGVTLGDENSNKNNIALVGRRITIKENAVIPSGEVVE